MSEKQNKKLEVISIAMLIVFALASFFITKNVNGNKANIASINNNNRNISIFVNGEKITYVDGIKIDINENRVFTIGDKNSDYNTIEIKNKKVRCIDANCPDKVCVNHNYLNNAIDNDMIVCAPHGLVILYN